MTKEQFLTETMTSIGAVLKETETGIVRSILVSMLSKVDFAESNALVTYEQNNEQFIRMFCAIKGARLSKRSMEVYLATLNNFLLVINKPLNKITALDIEYYLNCKCKTNTETSLNNIRRNLSAFFTWMRKKRFMDYNPCDEVEPYKEIKKPVDYMDISEMEMLKDGCKNPRDRALIEAFRSTALRVSEMISIKISDIDFTTGKILVYGQKSKKYRVVWLDKVAMGYVKKYLFQRGVRYDSDDFLFVNSRNGEPITASSIRKTLQSIRKNAGLERRIYPHLFRKDCATRIVKRGGTIEDAGRYLGHAEQTVTGKHYVAMDESATEEIFKKYVAIV